MKLRLIPFVDHEVGFDLLQKLIGYVAEDRVDIPAVITTEANRGAWWPAVDGLCLAANIPLLIYESEIRQNKLIHSADWFLLLSWKHLLPADLIMLPNQGVLNLHYSLLPSYRGIYPVNWAIINGEKTTGITYHFVNTKIDDGEVFLQFEVPIYLTDTARTLQLRLDKAASDNFTVFMERLIGFEAEKHEIYSRKASQKASEYYSRNRFEDVCRIDLNKCYKGIDFFNLLRGMAFFDDTKNVYILDREGGKKIYLHLHISEDDL